MKEWLTKVKLMLKRAFIWLQHVSYSDIRMIFTIHFFFRTVPVKVDLAGKNLKVVVDKVVNNTRCTIQGTGSSWYVSKKKLSYCDC